jgi:molybdopterin-guanine dinucleotide biosynthesis protein A
MFDAIVLAGGGASRLGGVAKPSVPIGSASMLQRVVRAVGEAAQVVVVGPPMPLDRPVTWCREDPPGAGPVAAIETGLSHATADRVVVLAADLPWVAPAVPVLLAALDVAEAAMLVDVAGRPNYLSAAWRRDALTAAVERVAEVRDAPVRALYEVTSAVPILDAAGWGEDCDTWEDVELARRRAEPEGTAP